MEQTCIVVADAGQARFFMQEGSSGSMRELSDMVNTAARLRSAELETDRHGPTAAGKSIHNTGGATPNKTYEPQQTPVEHEMERFARSIIGFLQEQWQAGAFAHLALVAAPEFLGVLRGMLSPQLKSALVWEINKDYTRHPIAELPARIAEHRQKQQN
jgi:protein required for attachment to host cells